MKIFLSWSGNRSKAVAELFKRWLPSVVQALDPWVSTDIEKGSVWLETITTELRDSAIGLVCVTNDNKNAPWVHFEAGALAKGLSQNRVCTFLIDVKNEDIDRPLSIFQSTLPKKEEVGKLIKTFNANLRTGRLDDERLNHSFEAFWPEFETKFQSILENIPAEGAAHKRTASDILTEVLSTVRGIEQKVNRLSKGSFGQAVLGATRPGMRSRVEDMFYKGELAGNSTTVLEALSGLDPSLLSPDATSATAKVEAAINQMKYQETALSDQALTDQLSAAADVIARANESEITDAHLAQLRKTFDGEIMAKVANKTQNEKI